MATWIEASPAQRFYQYILPDAKNQLAIRAADKARADLVARAADVEARYAVDVSPLRDRVRTRRLEILRREWRSVAIEEARIKALVARGHP